MRKTFLAIIVTLMSAGNFSAAQAAKTTVDPNAPKALAIESVDAAAKVDDKRLEQKVTYESTNKRLHTVLEELSSKTGVTIRCGESKNDWQVRDIPVVVCAKDLPLGKLLHAIADSTHLLMTSSKTENVRSYRIWRDAVRKKQIIDYFKAKDELMHALVRFQLDTWIKLASTPESQINIALQKLRKEQQNEYTDANLSEAMDFAAVAASLDESAKDKILSNEKLTLAVKDLPANQSKLVAALYRNSWRRSQENYSGDASEKESLSEEDVQRARLVIERDGHDDDPTITVRFEGSKDCDIDLRNSGWILPYISDTSHLIEPEPPTTDYADYLTKIEYKDYKVMPALQKQLKLGKLKNKNDSTVADIIAKVSKATSFSFIYEDFLSHKNSGHLDSEDSLLESPSVGDALRELANRGTIVWHIGSNRKIVVGSSEQWYEDCANLVPEILIKKLTKEPNGNGVELDDFVKLTSLSAGQLEEWFGDESYNSIWPGMNTDEEALWAFYDSLSKDEKKLVKSDAGLPLVKYSPSAMVPLFKKIAKASESMSNIDRIKNRVTSDKTLLDKFSKDLAKMNSETFNCDSNSGEPSAYEQSIIRIASNYPELIKRVEIPTNPSIIRRLFIHIKKTDAKEFCAIEDALNPSPTPAGPVDPNGVLSEINYKNRHVYYIEIMDGNSKVFTLPFPHVF